MTTARTACDAAAERLFAEQGDIAAILVEPMLANAGCLVPDPGYLETLQRLARQHGALLIMDEVLMGFRLQAGPPRSFGASIRIW
ncbi:aminotransferase class III-fold pyridoxal phosphate-dependent enzyme [Roseococcus sp.]|uniref:aminotransferase class III-fold pyridoxal phosphate-dependent enzyme n=1 Tax=Roseococcus sp. TaxID=2109646 RepID=UPI003BA85ED7